MAKASDKQLSLASLGFRQLGDGIHLYVPPAGVDAPDAKGSPGLIIFCTWAFAVEKHIAKYLQWYLRIYPPSQILVLQPDVANLIWRPDVLQASILEPALQAVKDYLSSIVNRHDPNFGPLVPKVMIHALSNAGAHTAVQIVEFYSTRSASDQSYPRLPIDALILDSSPGAPNTELTAKALKAGVVPNASSPTKSNALLRLIALSLHMVISTVDLLDATGITRSSVHKTWQVLKDPESQLLKEPLARTYIFSPIDQIVDVKDVKLHAQLSIQALEKIGAKDASERIRCQEFKDAPHVGHMLNNPKRYWTIVKETWSASQPA